MRKTRGLSPGDRRALRVGGVVLVPMLLWALGAAPYLRALDRARDRLNGSRDLLRRELALVAAAPRQVTALERAAADLEAVAPRLFAETADGLLGATLADYARERAGDERVRFTSLAPSAVEPRLPVLVAASLRVTGETDLEGLVTFLARLEAGPKLVQVHGLRVEARGAAGPAAGGAATGAELLSFELLATGFALREAAGDTARAAGDPAVDAGTGGGTAGIDTDARANAGLTAGSGAPARARGR